MRNLRALAIAVTPALLMSLVTPTVEAAPPVRLIYAQYDSPGDDTGSNRSLNAEWVRIKNFSATKKSLTGWTLRDPQGHVYRLGRYSLAAGKTVSIHTGSGRNSAAHRYWREDWYVWNNTGDKAILKNGAGATVDTCNWDDGDGTTAC